MKMYYLSIMCKLTLNKYYNFNDVWWGGEYTCTSRIFSLINIPLDRNYTVTCKTLKNNVHASNT